jgi:hypothetical protein
LPQTFCHNLFGGVLSFNIQNAIMGVWSFIIMFTYKNNCCLNTGPLPLNNSTCGQIFNRWSKIIHGSHQMTSFDPTLILGIKGLGRHRYWLIGAWTKSESPSIDFSGLVALGLKGLGSTTWGAFVLVIVRGPTHGSNVISLMSSTTILGGLTCGSICMFEVLCIQF